VLHAQGVEWQERRTRLFSILYPDGSQDLAASYARFVDGVYDETSGFWSYRPAAPIVLRLYPTMELYYQANPLAAKLPGVIAHAHTGRREISVAIPQTAGQSEEDIHNNVRHELTHIIAADLSAGRLTTPWQEGIAQYAEHPSTQLDVKMELMRQIVAEKRLLSWRELNQPGVTYSDPRVGYPESLTIVAFLLQRNGIERFRAFVEAMKEASGYREALEQAYGASADNLEREWLAQLPAYVNGGYRSPTGAANGPGAADLQEPERMIARGDFAGAVEKLRPMVESMRGSGDAAALRRGESLLARAEAGAQALRMAATARDALVRGDYEAAQTAGLAGQKELEALGLRAQATVAADYARQAARGLAAQAQLDEASALLRRFQLRPAQQRLQAAYQTFGELGNEARAGQARDALGAIERGERGLAGACLLCGGLLVAWSGRRQIKQRRVALPFT
jgi:hypothetical protein